MNDIVHLMLEGTTTELIVKPEPKMYIMEEQRRKAHAVCPIQKSTVCNAAVSPTVLEASV